MSTSDNILRTTGREAFQQSLRKSIHAASLQLQIPHSTVYNMLLKRVYKIQLIHALKPSDQAQQVSSNFEQFPCALVRGLVRQAEPE
jgi:hypothetical protein